MKGKSGGVLNGFLDKGARVEGTLSFDDTFRIDGFLKGAVLSDHELVVGEGGTVEGEIRVGRLSASGIIRGVVHAKDRIEIHAGAHIYAELHSPVLVVEEGAVIQGPVETGPHVEAKQDAKRPEKN
jgi:cytoskeletal protein CcmA (bactofilin family)